MDCLLLRHPLCFHIFISSSLQRSFGAPQSLGLRLSKNGWLNSCCWGIGRAGIGGGDLLDGSSVKGNDNGSLLGAFDELSVAPFGTLDAEITPETIDFFVSDAEGDPDCPSEGFSSIDQALDALRQEKFVIVVDDETGDVEGNLIMAASHASPQAMAFMVKHGSGIVSVGMKEEDLERLRLPLMSSISEEEDSYSPSFTVTVDAKAGVSTGVSAVDRAKTVLALSYADSKPEDFRRPGHVFPLKYRNGGILSRAGHTEASVDLVTLAGLRPVSVLSAIVDADDGSMAHLPKLRKLASEYGLPIVSITDLIRWVLHSDIRVDTDHETAVITFPRTAILYTCRYRRKRENLVERTAISRLPTKWGLFQAYCYRSKLDGTEHIAVVKGSVGNGQDVLVRVHSECLTGDIFGSARCDCGNQLALAMQLIEQAGRGVMVYLRGHEGRGIGLGHKLRAYNLQDQGHDTVEANLELGLAVDDREYGIGAQILRDIGVQTMRLMTNNPAKFTGLKGYGLAVVGRVPVLTPITEENKRYLETKRTKMGHVYGSDLHGQLAGFGDPNVNNTDPDPPEKAQQTD
ncbi:hypothetical protein HHK36_010930 [Tetracentron sinense]|uniref:GTP cyclohydrolase II n=1 Tax=Tetracentron sinense TaxID=13715 RepID=A0A834Z885_TETSI|nr:hypothetical protein HHK36_010930 [Tetracentron sinense]